MKRERTIAVTSRPEPTPHGLLHVALAVAGFAGAAGVALAAVSAHRVDSPALASAATMLTMHAGAAVGLVALAQRSAHPRRWLTVAAMMLAAVTLFSGDIAATTLGGFSLFPMATPAGGSLLIASWVIAALLALNSALRGD